jgi:hypothetical protein
MAIEIIGTGAPDGSSLGDDASDKIGLHGNAAEQATITTNALAAFVDQLATALSAKGIINYTGGTISGGANTGDYTLEPGEHIGNDPDFGGLSFDAYNEGIFSSNLTVNGFLAIEDGISEPATNTGLGTLYIDSADGDLKIKFADGTVKTIVVDT